MRRSAGAPPVLCGSTEGRKSRQGHGVARKFHEADRWIAATAVWLAVPLVTHDRVFLGVEGLDVLTMLDVDV